MSARALALDTSEAAVKQPTPPAPPASIAETGLHPDTLSQLMLKTLVAGEASGTGLAEALRLPYSVLDAMIQHARTEKLVEVRGASGTGTAGYRYILTDLGRDRAMQFMEVAYVAGLQKLSTLFSVIGGRVLYGERGFSTRFISSVVIFAGALMILFGR